MKIRMIYLAGGNSRRFGTNKLLELLDGKPMYRHLLDRLIRICGRHDRWELVVVTQYHEVAEELKEEPVRVRFCSESRMGASFSLKAGLENLTDEEACVFFVADQPFFREETAEGFLMEMEEKQARLGCVVFGEQMGNPVWFGREYFEELRQLTGDQGGRKVFRRYPEAVCFYRVQDAVELKDIDYLTEMPGKVAMKEESK